MSATASQITSRMIVYSSSNKSLSVGPFGTNAMKKVQIYHIFQNNDVIMRTMASQITSLRIVYSTVYSDADQRKHQSSASLAFVWGIHREPANSPYKWPVTRKMFPFDDVIMDYKDKYESLLLWFKYAAMYGINAIYHPILSLKIEETGQKWSVWASSKTRKMARALAVYHKWQ